LLAEATCGRVPSTRIRRRGAATAVTVRNESRMMTDIGTRMVARPLARSANRPMTVHAAAEVTVASVILARSGRLAWRQSRLYMPNDKKIASFTATERAA
jgi:hypothetical protein